jgi:hypothetical protein
MAGAAGAAGAAGLAAVLAFAGRVAAIRCETAGARGWLADPRLSGLAGEWLSAAATA